MRQELVRHTLHGIYHAAYRKMEKDSMEVAVHALCKGASSDGNSAALKNKVFVDCSLNGASMMFL